MSEKLFPEVPEDLAAADSSDLLALEKDIRAGIALVQAGDEEFLAGREGAEVIAALNEGVEALESIVAELDGRAQSAEEEVEKAKASADERVKALREMPEEKTEEAEVVAEAETPAEDEPAPDDGDGEDGAVVEEEKELVVAAVEEPAKPASPAPAKDRIVVSEPEHKITPITAAGGLPRTIAGTELDEMGLASAIVDQARNLSVPPFGHKIRSLVATAQFEFPEERTLDPKDVSGNNEKIKAVIPKETGWGKAEVERPALTAAASANFLCAPPTPFYALPNFASEARPVRDSLPSFRADRGGVNVPVAPTIGDITTAISLIDQSDESAGGTFATKSCQAMDCVDYNETFVTTISHCRQFGNLQSRAWPERIALENALTMAAHARTAEEYLLDQIKAQSVNVTNGAETLGALIYLVDAIVKSRFGIVSRLRMDPETVFRALLPAVLPDLLQLDNVQTQYDRFQSEEQLVAYLRGYDIEPTFYMDTPTTGDSQIADASQAAGALDGLPDTIQWAIFPEGAFLHLDGGALELGIVRDSTLNETNEFQVFGETFENVARIAPPQAAYWVTSDLCASGQFPPAGTARACD